MPYSGEYSTRRGSGDQPSACRTVKLSTGTRRDTRVIGGVGEGFCWLLAFQLEPGGGRLADVARLALIVLVAGALTLVVIKEWGGSPAEWSPRPTGPPSGLMLRRAPAPRRSSARSRTGSHKSSAAKGSPKAALPEEWCKVQLRYALNQSLLSLLRANTSRRPRSDETTPGSEVKVPSSDHHWPQLDPL